MNMARIEQLEEMAEHGASVGVQWQAQMELHLHDVRTLTHEAMLPNLTSEARQVRAALAQAAGIAALALAIANASSDIELAVTRHAEAIEDGA